jgi:TRAP-type C4-dicarboxylate transport system permease large subunit
MWEALWAAKWVLALPIPVLVGIYEALVTINEAAVVTAAYSLQLVCAACQPPAHTSAPAPSHNSAYESDISRG